MKNKTFGTMLCATTIMLATSVNASTLKQSVCGIELNVASALTSGVLMKSLLGKTITIDLVDFSDTMTRCHFSSTIKENLLFLP